MRWNSRRSTTRALIALSVIAISCVLAACGSEGGSAGPVIAGKKDVTPEIPKSGCGSVATPLPKDPDGAVASLPKESQAKYAGYVPTVTESVWADFKPNHPPPYKVGLVYAQITSAAQAAMYESMKKGLGNDPDIKFTGVSTGSQLNIPEQQQLYNGLLNTKPDLLIVQPLADAFGALVDKAGKQGIPTISFQGTTTSKYAINMQSNNFFAGAQGASVTFRQMGGKGNVFYVRGLPSTTFDQDAYNGYRAALKNCPGIKEVGAVSGAFLPATAQSETLKFLATHPQRIDGVVNSSGMAPGIISAFKQAGRPIPIVNDRGGQRGSLGYWINNPDFTGFGQGFPAARYGGSVTSVVKRMLAGRGLTVSDITDPIVPITEKNLSQWADKSWSLTTPGLSAGPPQTFMTEAFLSTLFRDPAPVK